MIKKCLGCGIVMQSCDTQKEGYVRKEKYEDALYCERCFKLKHYNKVDDSSFIPKNMFDEIVCQKKYITYLVDILNIDDDAINYIQKCDKNNLIILITKFDILPKGIKEGKIIKYFKENYFDADNIFCISSKTKYNIDKYYNFLVSKNIKETYLLGNTNAGKSSFINALLEAKNKNPYIVISSNPNTTRDIIGIDIDGIKFYDTPGFNNKSIYNFIPNSSISKIAPKKELKVKTFQIKEGESIIVDKILRIDNIKNNNSFNFYINNNLNYKKVNINKNNELKKLPNKAFIINGKEDILVSGLGFIKINSEGSIIVYSLDNEIITKRTGMI